jgi:hypothetical protein
VFDAPQALLDARTSDLFLVEDRNLDTVVRQYPTYAGHCHAEKPATLCRLIRERLQQALAQHQEK